jgi:DNA-binding transcriptional LysR family regulator
MVGLNQLEVLIAVVESEPLFEEGMVLVAAAGSPLRRRALRPADLVGQRFLMREMGSATRRQQEAALRAWGLDRADTWDLWGPDTLKEAVHAGLGLALLSEHMTARERASGTLAELSVDPPRRAGRSRSCAAPTAR